MAWSLDCLRVVQQAQVQGETIDVILMDNNMPNMIGTEATRVLRESGYRGVIFGVTGDVLEEDVKKFLNGGATDVLFKPLNVEILKRALYKVFCA
jgi:CheY-like chemotaxis protein